MSQQDNAVLIKYICANCRVESKEPIILQPDDLTGLVADAKHDVAELRVGKRRHRPTVLRDACLVERQLEFYWRAEPDPIHEA